MADEERMSMAMPDTHAQDHLQEEHADPVRPPKRTAASRNSRVSRQSRQTRVTHLDADGRASHHPSAHEEDRNSMVMPATHAQDHLQEEHAEPVRPPKRTTARHRDTHHDQVSISVDCISSHCKAASGQLVKVTSSLSPIMAQAQAHLLTAKSMAEALYNEHGQWARDRFALFGVLCMGTILIRGQIDGISEAGILALLAIVGVWAMGWWAERDAAAYSNLDVSA